MEDFDETPLEHGEPGFLEASEEPEGDAAKTPEILLKGQIEAALFITAKPLTFTEISEILETDLSLVEDALMDLMNDYAFREGSALEIDDTDGYILQVREDYSQVVHKMMPMEFSQAALRTLSAIAVKSPVLQSDLIEMRGSSAYDHIHELLAKKLITKRRQGRSFILNHYQKF